MKYIGAENEYTAMMYIGKAKKKTQAVIPNIKKAIARKLLSDNEVLWAGRNFINSTFDFFSVWLNNGGKIYIDGDSTEYATAECETVEELVCAEKAGEIILPKIFSQYDQENLFLLKRTSNSSLFTSDGSHENYAINPNLFFELTEDKGYLTKEQVILISHLVTRIIYTGAGHICADKKMDYAKFILSPRVNFIKQLLSKESKVNRPLIHQKNEELVVPSIVNISRLHLICGDMNRSDWSLYLKYGATALLLAYMEIASDNELHELARKILLINPLQTMQMISNSIGDSADALRMQFKKAAKIQREIIKNIESHQPELQITMPELKKIIHYWEMAIDSPFTMKNKLDWRIKRSFIENTIGDDIFKLNRIKDKTIIRKILGKDLNYHRINNHDFYNKMIETEQIIPMYQKNKIAESITKPPKGRAGRRARLAQHAINMGLRINIHLTWSEMNIKKDHVILPMLIFFDEENEAETKSAISIFAGKNES